MTSWTRCWPGRGTLVTLFFLFPGLLEPVPAAPDDAPPLVLCVELPATSNAEDAARSAARLAVFTTALLAPRWAALATHQREWEALFGATSPLATAMTLARQPADRFAVGLPPELRRLVRTRTRRFLALRLDHDARLTLVVHDGATRRQLELGASDAGVGGIETDTEFPVEDRVRLVTAGLSRLLGIRPRASEVVVASLDARRLTGDLVGAGAVARALSVHLAKSPHPRRILAQCAAGRGRFEEAARYWKEAIERDTRDPFLHLEHGKALAAAESPVEACSALQRAIALCASDADSIAGRARAVIVALEPARRAEESRRTDWKRARAELRTVEEARANALRSAPTGTRLLELERRVAATPAGEDAWFQLGTALLDAGLLARARAVLASAVDRYPRSVRLRIELARSIFRDGRHEDAASVLRTSMEAERDTAALVLLGDCRMALAGGEWTSARWSDLAAAASFPGADPCRRIWRPAEGSPAASHWESAGDAYGRAVLAESDDGRALARLVDWLLLSGHVGEARERLRGGNGVEACVDLDRVRACVLLATGEEAASRRAMDRFLEHGARGVESIGRVVRRFLAADDPRAVERAARLVDRALGDHPCHVDLRLLRARVLRRLGRVEEALHEYRFALAASDSAWSALRRLWENPPRGLRSSRPPETPARFAGNGAGALLPGAPRALTRLIELRMELAEILLAFAPDPGGACAQPRPCQALAELRPAEWFLQKEEVRLRVGRLARDDTDREWTRPADGRDEPVDFGNSRHRLVWARLRMLIARCLRVRGDHAESRRLFVWAARVLAVRNGTVLPEAVWSEQLSRREQVMAAAAIAAIGELTREAGRTVEAEKILQWSRQLRSPGA